MEGSWSSTDQTFAVDIGPNVSKTDLDNRASSPCCLPSKPMGDCYGQQLFPTDWAWRRRNISTDSGISMSSSASFLGSELDNNTADEEEAWQSNTRRTRLQRRQHNDSVEEVSPHTISNDISLPSTARQVFIPSVLVDFRPVDWGSNKPQPEIPEVSPRSLDSIRDVHPAPLKVADEDRPPKRSKPNSSSESEKKHALRYACPYRKHDPRKYSMYQHKTCALSPFDSIGRTK